MPLLDISGEAAGVRQRDKRGQIGRKRGIRFRMWQEKGVHGRNCGFSGFASMRRGAANEPQKRFCIITRSSFYSSRGHHSIWNKVNEVIIFYLACEAISEHSLRSYTSCIIQCFRPPFSQHRAFLLTFLLALPQHRPLHRLILRLPDPRNALLVGEPFLLDERTDCGSRGLLG